MRTLFCWLAIVVVFVIVAPRFSLAQDDKPVDETTIKRFKETDTDSSGSISKEEFEADVKDKIDWFTKIDEFMNQLDSNSDGSISPKEFANRNKVLDAILEMEEKENPEKPVVEFAERFNRRYVKDKPAVGDTIEDLIGLDEFGNDLNFDDLRGKYVVLNFGCLT